MLLENKKVSVQASGMKDTVNFRAKLDGMMFDNLINGIYSNKIGAGIREYSTNARDGQARKGNLDTPFEVSLPTKDHAFFEVRDFGSSLTHDEVFNIYAVLGESTKRDTNDETGCLGLGSKSAFAYTNTFTVTCWKDGRKRDYTCYIGEAGQPKVSLISEIRSNEPEGVRVSYAVKQEDIDSFNREATKQLRGFRPMPEVKRHNQCYKALTGDNLILKGEFWEIYKPEGSDDNYWRRPQVQPMAIQGSVAYPINNNNNMLRQKLREFDDKLSNNTRKGDVVIRLLEYTDLIVNFPIGELKMTTSREELSYDEDTCTNLAKRLFQVVDEIQEKLNQEYAACKSLKEARILRAKTLNKGQADIDKALRINERYWNNIRIEPKVYVAEVDGLIGQLTNYYQRPNSFSNYKNEFIDNKSVTGQLRIIDQHNYKNKFGEFKANFQFPEKSNRNSSFNTQIYANEINNTVVLIEVDGVDKVNGRMRNFWKNKLSGHKEFIWVKVKNKTDAQLFLEYIYHDNAQLVFYLDEIDDLKMPKKGVTTGSITTANSNERKFRYIEGKRYCYSSDSATYENLDFSVKREYPVVFFSDGKFYFRESEMTDTSNGLNYIEMCGVIRDYSGGFKAYVVNGQQMTFYKDNKQHFVDAIDTLKTKWMSNNKDWEESYAKSTWKEDGSDNKEYGRKLLILKNKYNIEFRSIKDHLTADKTISEPQTRMRYLSSLPRMYSKYMETELENAIKKFPQPAQDYTYINFINNRPVLKYLINELRDWGTDLDLADAIRDLKSLINE